MTPRKAHAILSGKDRAILSGRDHAIRSKKDHAILVIRFCGVRKAAVFSPLNASRRKGKINRKLGP